LHFERSDFCFDLLIEDSICGNVEMDVVIKILGQILNIYIESKDPGSAPNRAQMP
tara:strand:+ start:4383 stop:4547 length:165 start_codon:yes stop_codon:yes gene_type:complete